MGALLSSPYLATGDFPLMPPHTPRELNSSLALLSCMERNASTTFACLVERTARHPTIVRRNQIA